MWGIKTFVCSKLVETEMLLSSSAVRNYQASVRTKTIYRDANKEKRKNT